MALREEVSHGVGIASNMGDFMMLVMMAMMQAGEPTEVGSSLVQGDGALLVLRDGSNVVIESHKSELPDVEKEGGHVSLSKNPSLL